MAFAIYSYNIQSFYDRFSLKLFELILPVNYYAFCPFISQSDDQQKISKYNI